MQPEKSEFKISLKKLLITAVVVITCIYMFSYGYRYVLYFKFELHNGASELYLLISGKQNSAISDNQLSGSAQASGTNAEMVNWKVLATASPNFTKHGRGNLPKPIFNDEIKALNNKIVKAKGFMFPLDQTREQTHFLLSPYPVTCPFCLPAGPSELIEIKPKKAVKLTYESITVEGGFELLNDDYIKKGLFYRMTGAVLLE